MTKTQHGLTLAQFDPQANAYVSSTVHASGADLDALERLVAGAQLGSALDLGCGGGHVSYRLAPHVGQLTAYDLSQAMLDAVGREAAGRGLGNIALRRGAAEALPFADASFDLVVTRYSAHHWTDMAAGVKEIRRVLKPGGRAVIIDVVSPGPPALDTYLQAVELLRDPSHIRDYSAVEWLAAVADAGLKLERCELRPLALDFGTWIERMKPPRSHAEAICSLQALMPQDVAAAFVLRPDGSFQVDSAMIEAVRPG